MVVNDTGDDVQSRSVLDDGNRKHMFAELPPSLPPGRYTIIWHTLSDEDGEEAEGAFHFYVGTGPTSGTSTPVATTQTPAGSPTSTPRNSAPAPTSTPNTNGGNGDEGVSAGAVISMIAGSLVAGVAVGGGATWLLMRQRP
jgi:hypothetical protein